MKNLLWTLELNTTSSIAMHMIFYMFHKIDFVFHFPFLAYEFRTAQWLHVFAPQGKFPTWHQILSIHCGPDQPKTQTKVLGRLLVR